MNISIDFAPAQSQNYTVFIDALERLTLRGKVAIVTNPKVAGLHLASLLARIDADEVYVITVPDGESHKTLQNVEMILENLFMHRFDRNATLIAFGGGVVGDMTGFAAAIFQRGIRFIQIPTTLLSQVDASVGGKTGVNNRFGKNLIGAFHQPSAVYCQSEFLATLPAREFGAGVAEIVKMAVTFDADFVAYLENHPLSTPSHLREAIARSIAIKARVVAEDEKEAGVRAVLNYGHTFGHVIENETGYTAFLHGEAVAIGMRMANALAQKLGYLTQTECARIEKLLEQYGLLFRYPVQNPERFYNAFFLDKKSLNATITFIVPKSIGGYAIVKDAPKETVLEVLREFDR
ncbi:MAG: 3-dehydroquinate synthase [Campylobacterales bacterium]|nr:3-dehydroquinate synthase [Campylobacterales bacterium]